jgi:hypothetical protein
MNRALLSHFSIGMLLLSSVLFVAFSVLVNMVTDAPRCSAESRNIIYTTVFAIRILQTIHMTTREASSFEEWQSKVGRITSSDLTLSRAQAIGLAFGS